MVGGRRRICRSAGLLGFGVVPGCRRVFSRFLPCNSWLVGDVCFGAHPELCVLPVEGKKGNKQRDYQITLGIFFNLCPLPTGSN